MPTPYQRVLLKLSGEAFMGSEHFGIDPGVAQDMAQQIAAVHRKGIQIGIVIGGGNIWRGLSARGKGMDRATADYMGMVATVLNAMALQDALEKLDVHTRVMTAIAMNEVDGMYSADPRTNPTATRCEAIIHQEALEKDLKIKDAAALALCRDNHVPIMVFDVTADGAIAHAIDGDHTGTLVSSSAYTA